MWGHGFRQCGRPPLPLDFVSLDIAAILPVVATVVAFSRDVQQSATVALTLDLRWGLLDMLHFPVATEVVSGGAAVRRVGLRYSAYRLFGTMQTFLQSLYRRRWSN